MTAVAATLLSGFVGSASGADAASCQSVIARASAAYVDGRATVLARCEDGRATGRIRVGDPCTADPATQRALEALRVDLFADINRACGGANRDCGDADDLPLPSTGWGEVATCPDLAGSGCTNAVTSCVGIANCLQCMGATAVDLTLETAAGAFETAVFGTSNPVNRCQRAITKAVSKFVGTRAKTLRKCWNARLSGRHANPCPDPGDGKAVSLLARAETRKVAAICKACGGPDGLCNGSADLTPAAIGFAPTCPDVSRPDGTRCAGPVGDLFGLVRCIDCVAEAATDCTDAAAVPGLTTYPAACNAVATTTTTTTLATTTTTSTTTTTTTSSSTTTSSTTTTSTTAPSSTTTTSSSTTTTGPSSTTTTTSSTTTTTISSAVTCGTSNTLDATATLVYDPRIVGGVFGMFLEVDYPAAVSIPGSGTASSVRTRFTNLIGTANYRLVASDIDTNSDGRDDRARALVTANTSEPIPSVPIMRVRFDCPAGTIVQPSQLPCRPADIADSAGQLFPPEVAAQVACTLSLSTP